MNKPERIKRQTQHETPNRKDKTMNALVTIRNGSSKQMPGEIRSGKAWLYDADGKRVPMIDGQAPESVAYGIDRIVAHLKAGDFDAIPSGCQARAGENKSGLTVMDASDYHPRKRLARDKTQPCPYCGTYCDGDCQAHRN